MLHPKKKVCACARVRVCACVRVILVLVWGTFYVPHTYVPGISTYERSEFLIATSPRKSLRVCACARVRVCSCNLGFSVGYVLCTTYVRTWYQHVCTWYQRATKIRIAEIAYIPGWGMYYVRHTYVPGISTYVSGISRLPRYVYVDTYVPGLHPKKKEN